jgi:hypothetical protein
MLTACSPGPLSNQGSETESTGASETESETESESESTDTETESTDETETGPIELEPCTCVVGENLGFICTEATLNDCDLPSPCGVVSISTPDAEAATCVLQLLIDQAQPSQFDHFETYDDGFEDWSGTFYILGPGTGIDLDCHQVDLSGDFTPAVHAINEPAYFQACLGQTASEMTECIFNGLTATEPVPLCAP